MLSGEQAFKLDGSIGNEKSHSSHINSKSIMWVYLAWQTE
jgi:hypothetical protein